MLKNKMQEMTEYKIFTIKIKKLTCSPKIRKQYFMVEIPT
jgi:hypothetical protein